MIMGRVPGGVVKKEMAQQVVTDMPDQNERAGTVNMATALKIRLASFGLRALLPPSRVNMMEVAIKLMLTPNLRVLDNQKKKTLFPTCPSQAPGTGFY